MTFHGTNTPAGCVLSVTRNGSWLRLTDAPVADRREIALLILGYALGASKASFLCDEFAADVLGSSLSADRFDIDSQTIEQWLIERSVAA